MSSSDEPDVSIVTVSTGEGAKMAIRAGDSIGARRFSAIVLQMPYVGIGAGIELAHVAVVLPANEIRRCAALAHLEDLAVSVRLAESVTGDHELVALRGA